jgi:hypothetical protein
VLAAMVSIAMPTALGQHANQDSQCLIIENVGGTVWLIQYWWVRIIVVNVIVAFFSFRLNKDVFSAIKVVSSVMV